LAEMKNFSRRDFLKLGGAALLAASSPKLEFAEAEAPKPVPVLWQGSTHHRYVALTYDDCYLLNRMHDLEMLLDAYPEFKVTLFPVGEAIENLRILDESIWQRFYERGHEIGYHSWNHQNFANTSLQFALDDYARWLDALTQALGFQPSVHFARPTFGNITPSFEELCRAQNLVATMWSTGWGGDPKDGFHAVQQSKNGDVVLMHIRTQDYETSLQAYPWLRENGWGSVTLSKMFDDLLLEQYYSADCDKDFGNSLNRTCIE
jgi:peptidoglycan/xylan/chitin deacetylase (PgdA/CDA1 family)